MAILIITPDNVHNSYGLAINNSCNCENIKKFLEFMLNIYKWDVGCKPFWQSSGCRHNINNYMKSDYEYFEFIGYPNDEKTQSLILTLALDLSHILYEEIVIK